jgi:hypothetical protein
MGILSDFFIAGRESTPTYDPGRAFPAEDRCEFKSITPLEAAGILSVLRGSGDPVEMMDEFPLVTPEEAEEWIMNVPDEMADRLRALDDERLVVAARQCAEVTAEELRWSAEDFDGVLRDLRRLARRAAETGKRMHLWNSL